MRKVLIVSVATTLSLASMAHPGHGQRQDKKRRPAGIARLLKAKSPVCKKVKLSDEQKVAIKQLLQDSRAGRVELKKSLKSAQKELRKSIRDESVSLEDTIVASNKLADAKAAIQKAAGVNKATVLKTILEKEQIGKAKKCLLQGKAMKLQKRLRQLKKRTGNRGQGNGRRGHGRRHDRRAPGPQA